MKSTTAMTQDERWVANLCSHMLNGLDTVPDHRIVDIFGIAGGIAIGRRTSSRDPITIMPIDPTDDSGKKKPPKGVAPVGEQTETRGTNRQLSSRGPIPTA